MIYTRNLVWIPAPTKIAISWRSCLVQSIIFDIDLIFWGVEVLFASMIGFQILEAEVPFRHLRCFGPSWPSKRFHQAPQFCNKGMVVFNQVGVRTCGSCLRGQKIQAKPCLTVALACVGSGSLHLTLGEIIQVPGEQLPYLTHLIWSNKGSPISVAHICTCAVWMYVDIHIDE